MQEPIGELVRVIDVMARLIVSLLGEAGGTPERVRQRHEHDPEKGVLGDCSLASFATLLGVPYEEVPDMRGLPAGEWQRVINAWLRGYGLAYVEVSLDWNNNQFAECGVSGLWSIVGGESPRFPGVGHHVVGCDGDVKFDPHASAAGLKEKQEVGVIVLLEPWRFVEAVRAARTLRAAMPGQEGRAP